MNELGIALFLAGLNKALVDLMAAPVRERWPAIDLWWLIYVALVTGAFIGWVSGVNLLADYVPHAAIGRILTAVIIGGGSSVLHDLFKTAK